MIRFLFILSLTLNLISCDFSNDNPPNIIVIISDDQGYADVGFHGSKEIFTPNIDRIANNGVFFLLRDMFHMLFVLQVEQD